MTPTKTSQTSATALSQAQTIVIKIGSALVCDLSTNKVREGWFKALAKDIAALRAQGKRIIIVSSGGVALGRSVLGISPQTPPSKIPLAQKQASSAIGQYHMYNAYHQALNTHDIHTAQVLLTLSETENRSMFLNARATLTALLDSGVIPIINENDSISTEEIRFGDNDRLSVRIAQMLGADVTLLLSTIDGLYTANPEDDATAQHIPYVPEITGQHKNMAGEAKPGLSTGGMKSKLTAAINAVNSGITLIIADGRPDHALKNLTSNTAKSTLFQPSGTTTPARKSWIGSHLKPSGQITIDDGAAKALRNGKSLLPVGVTAINGTFERGDIVTIQDQHGTTLATGITAYSADHANLIKGQQSTCLNETLGYTGRRALVHRNDLVMK